jgi:hypothetical protein
MNMGSLDVTALCADISRLSDVEIDHDRVGIGLRGHLSDEQRPHTGRHWPGQTRNREGHPVACFSNVVYDIRVNLRESHRDDFSNLRSRIEKKDIDHGDAKS